MRQHQVANTVIPALTALALLLATTAYAQTSNNNPDDNANQIAQTLGAGSPTPATQPQGQIMPGNSQTPQIGQPAPGFYPQPGFYYPPGYQPQIFGPPEPTEEEVSAAQMNALLNNPDSPQYKANKLADKAKRDGDVVNFARSTVVDEKETVTDIETPPEMDTLQDVHKTHGTTYNVTDAEIEEELLNLDIRRDAQKEAALSYGARGGLAKRNYQLAERLNGYEGVMDQVFNFRALLVKAPSGLLIEPPIVRESLENIFVNGDGSEAAVADAVLDINKQAKIVTAPRDWRNYLMPAYESEITPPPRVLWPKDDKEQAEWNTWVKQGWTAGYEQGEETFETNLNQLTSDYNGMVRYRLLLAQGMISAPFALHEDRGVTGTANLMRVGDRALRITGPSQFLTGSDLWKPADR
jgi:defect-in-organelle-trafficking protein DotC